MTENESIGDIGDIVLGTIRKGLVLIIPLTVSYYITAYFQHFNIVVMLLTVSLLFVMRILLDKRQHREEINNDVNLRTMLIGLVATMHDKDSEFVKECSTLYNKEYNEVLIENGQAPVYLEFIELEDEEE